MMCSMRGDRTSVRVARILGKPQHDRTVLIKAYDVERILADINANDGDCSVEFLRHSVLLVFGAPCQRNLRAGQEHGRDHSISGHSPPDELAR